MNIDVLDTPFTQDHKASEFTRKIISTLDWEMSSYSSDTKVGRFVGKDKNGVARLELEICMDDPACETVLSQ